MAGKHLFLLVLFPLVLSGNIAVAIQDEFLVNRVNHQQLIKRNIENIVQDQTGFLWFGTSNGLIRFDGHSTLPFTHNVNDSASLPSNQVRSMLLSKDGTLWITTQGGGLSRYNPETQTFRTFTPTPPPGEIQDIDNLDFWHVSEGSDGYLWIASYGGSQIYRFNTDTESFSKIPISPTDGRHFTSTLQILHRQNGEVWVATDESGIVVLDSQANKLRRYRANRNNDFSLQSDSVYELVEDQNGTLWIGTFQGGLHYYNDATGTFARPERLYSDSSNRHTNITALLVDSNNSIWLGSDDGIVRLSSDFRQIIAEYRHEPFSERSLSNNRVRTLYEDRNGIIWAGNEHGGAHRLLRHSRFTHINPSTTGDGPTTAVIRTFLQTDDRTLWIGTQGGGINVMDMRTNQLRRTYTNDPDNPNSLANNGITSLMQDHDGGIWVGTWGGGLNHYHPDTGKFSHLRRSDDPNSISDDRIQFIRKDSQNRIWVGTENGLNLFDRQNRTFTRILHEPSQENSLYAHSFQTMAYVEDADDVFWLGTWQGLIRYDHRNETVRKFTSDLTSANSISSNHAIALHDDGIGNLWIGTFGGGLNRFDKATETFEFYIDNDGLPSNVIFAILEDENKNLWLSTNNGISRYQQESGFFRNFNQSDGLRNIEYWWGSATKLNDNRLVFGSTYGYTIFNPNEIQENTYIPALVISSFEVLGKPVILGNRDRIELNYTDNYFTISFAALDFTAPERNQYAFKMEGLDTDWIYSGNLNMTSYSSLKGGHYTFRVRGTNSDGIWNNEGTYLHIYIRPPFWQTSWFIFLSLIFAASVVALIIRYRTKAVNEQNRLLEDLVNQRTKDLALKQEELLCRNNELSLQTARLLEQKTKIEQQKDQLLKNSEELKISNQRLTELNQEKNSLIGIVAHDLRSPLTSVKSALQIIKMDPDLPADELNELHNVMEYYVDNQLSMITRLLDIEALESGKVSLNLEPVDPLSITRRLIDEYKESCAKKQITIKSVLPKSAVPVMADANHFEQIIDNLISNAIKFSPVGSTVTIKHETEKEKVRLGVIDEGPGLTEDDMKKLFGKFQKLSARPTGGEKSTGLGLSIVKRFVEAMDGRVWCESKPGEGAAFWVELNKDG